jgi:hypothetical protein
MKEGGNEEVENKDWREKKKRIRKKNTTKIWMEGGKERCERYPLLLYSIIISIIIIIIIIIIKATTAEVRTRFWWEDLGVDIKVKVTLQEVTKT